MIHHQYLCGFWSLLDQLSCFEETIFSFRISKRSQNAEKRPFSKNSGTFLHTEILGFKYRVLFSVSMVKNR